MKCSTVALVVLMAGAIAGCSKKPPTQAGGKPVSYWVQALDAPDPHLRKEAVEKLGNVGPADPAARPAVLRALRDKDAHVRRAAILAVVKFGRPDADVADSLADLKAHDPDGLVRNYADRALQSFRNMDGS